jgi:hypothetical protein
MPERQIAFASTWFHRGSEHVVGHRGEVLDIPEDEIERLEKLGALVPEGGELDRPGKLLPLLANASEEQIRNYIESGKADEILEQVDDYPVALIERVLIAERAGQAREGLVTALDAKVRGVNELTEPVTVPDVMRPIPAETVTPSAEPMSPTEGDGEDLVEFVSTNTVEAVLERAGEDSELAAALRAAEESRGDKARKGVIEGLTKIENAEA